MNKLDLDYKDILNDILINGHVKDDRTGTGTISTFGQRIVHNMSTGFPVLTTKKVHFNSILTELIWFMKGRTDLRWLLERGNTIWVGDAYKKYVTYASNLEEPDYDVHVDDPMQNCTRLMTRPEFIEMIKTNDEFSERWGNLGPIYGKQWRDWGGIDQLQNAIDTLRTNPDSRRIMVNAWNPAEMEDMTLPPCHYGFQVYTRELSAVEREDYFAKKNNYTSEERYGMHPNHTDDDVHMKMDEVGVPKRGISLMFNMRSNDVPLGLPFNITSYGLLLEIFGKMVNMIPEKLIGNLGDAHIYVNQVDGVKEQLKRDIHPLPKLEISDNIYFDGTLDEMLDSLTITRERPDIQLVDYKHEDPIKFPLSN